MAITVITIFFKGGGNTGRGSSCGGRSREKQRNEGKRKKKKKKKEQEKEKIGCLSFFSHFIGRFFIFNHTPRGMLSALAQVGPSPPWIIFSLPCM